jgi:predicted metal-dependent HD superfamily phosphohydrolase
MLIILLLSLNLTLHFHMMEITILESTRSFVETFFRTNIPDNICYHNLQHTYEVVRFTEFIGGVLNLDDKQLETAMIASWFHDLGYYKGHKGHEEVSALVASVFLKNFGCDKQMIAEIESCILATRIPQKPYTLVEEVVCDADLSHLASEHYFEKAESLRKEMEAYEGKEIDEDTWLLKNLIFFENHNYFTSYGKTILQPQKQKNYEKIILMKQNFSFSNNN